MLSLFGSLAWAQTDARELAFSDWGVNVEPSVVTKAFSKEAVRDFIGAFTYAITKETTLLRPDVYELGINDLAWGDVREANCELPGAQERVGALTWADVDADGVYELLATMDNGRPMVGNDNPGFYNNFFIVKQVEGAYRRQRIFINPADTFMESLEELRNSRRGYCSICDQGCAVVISDLDHDGTLELILPMAIASYWLGNPTPLWTSIYKWEKTGYVEADEQFRGFYEDILLPDVERMIAALSRGKSEAEQDLDEELTTEWVTRDKIVRFLGRDLQAGFQRAIRWAKSADPDLRENAAITLSEIPGGEAARYVEELAVDPDGFYAQNVLKKRCDKAWAKTEAHELALSDWRTNIEPSVVTKAFSKEAVRDLIAVFTFAEYKTFLGPEIHEIAIDDLAWSEVHDLRGRLPGALGAVGAFKWADVDADGVYELLVTMDYSRAFYNHLLIVKQVAGAYREQEISINSSDRFLESPDALRNSDRGSWSTCCTVVISDMDHDGTLELILPIELVFGRGARPTPLWTSIYKWKRYRYAEADE